MSKTKVNLGCGWRNFGDDWLHIDNGDYEHLDYKVDVTKKLPLDDNSMDLVYASHVIAYFDRNEIIEILKEWRRVLKSGGVLRLATPNFKAMVELYYEGVIELPQILGPLYGKMPMGDETIYHRTVYDMSCLKKVLESLDFYDVDYYDWKESDYKEFDDHSQSYIPHMDKDNGTLISLNIECKKS